MGARAIFALSKWAAAGSEGKAHLRRSAPLTPSDVYIYGRRERITFPIARLLWFGSFCGMVGKKKPLLYGDISLSFVVHQELS